MADYYTKASFALNLPGEAYSWLCEVGVFVIDCQSDPETVAPEGFTKEETDTLREIAKNSASIGCEYEWQADEKYIWLYSDDGFEPDAVASVCQLLLRRFAPDSTVTFEWANDCSKLRLDSFGGGAAFITKDQIDMQTTTEWVNTKLASLAKKETPECP